MDVIGQTFCKKKLTKIKALSDSVAVVFSLRSLGDYHSQVLGGANSLKQEEKLQHFRLNTDPDPGFLGPNSEKNYN